MNRYIEENLHRGIDHNIEKDNINKHKKNQYSLLPTDLGIAKFFIGTKVKADIYNGLSNPFFEKMITEGIDYPYNHEDLMDALAYMRTLSAIKDENSNVFKNVYNKKKSLISNENISDIEAKKEIVRILKNDLSTEETQENHNLESYLMKYRKSNISYYVDPNNEKRFTNSKSKQRFKEKTSQYSIEDITFNKLSLMILRDYFESFFDDKKEQLGRDNFRIKIANNYDNIMGESHLIVWFRDKKTMKEKHFVLHINTQGEHKKIPNEIIPYDFSAYLNTNNKGKPIKMSMNSLPWGNKKLLYTFIGNAIEIIKEKGELSKEDINNAFESSGIDHSTNHIKGKLVELLVEDKMAS